MWSSRCDAARASRQPGDIRGVRVNARTVCSPDQGSEGTNRANKSRHVWECPRGWSLETCVFQTMGADH